jgi:FixJ family two-component response regulator
MGLTEILGVGEGGGVPIGAQPAADVVVLEDDPQLAALAVEICEGIGLRTVSFAAPAPFLDSYRMLDAPRVVVLDWRLERELGAAVFMALRHRFGDVPIVCWTGMAAELLPAMVTADTRTRVVAKAEGVGPFQDAVSWALENPARPAQRA